MVILFSLVACLYIQDPNECEHTVSPNDIKADCLKDYYDKKCDKQLEDYSI